MCTHLWDDGTDKKKQRWSGNHLILWPFFIDLSYDVDKKPDATRMKNFRCIEWGCGIKKIPFLKGKKKRKTLNHLLHDSTLWLIYWEKHSQNDFTTKIILLNFLFLNENWIFFRWKDAAAEYCFNYPMIKFCVLKFWYFLSSIVAE